MVVNDNLALLAIDKNDIRSHALNQIYENFERQNNLKMVKKRERFSIIKGKD
jgi:hypothetical protein